MGVSQRERLRVASWLAAAGGLVLAFLVGQPGSDTSSSEGRSRVPAPACTKKVFGGPGQDTIRGSRANELIRGRAGADFLAGAAGRDCVIGGIGDDRVRGGRGRDGVSGGGGSDLLRGGLGRDRFSGGVREDTIKARDGGRDVVFCGDNLDVAFVDRSDLAFGCEIQHPPKGS